MIDAKLSPVKLKGLVSIKYTTW